MPYIKKQTIAHENRTVTSPAIALKNFAIVIRPQGEIYKDCAAFQILHKQTGRHIATFSIAECAIDCLKKLDDVFFYSEKLKFPVDRDDALLISDVVAIAIESEMNHPELLWDEEQEYCPKGEQEESETEQQEELNKDSWLETIL